MAGNEPHPHVTKFAANLAKHASYLAQRRAELWAEEEARRAAQGLPRDPKDPNEP